MELPLIYGRLLRMALLGIETSIRCFLPKRKREISHILSKRVEKTVPERVLLVWEVSGIIMRLDNDSLDFTFSNSISYVYLLLHPSCLPLKALFSSSSSCKCVANGSEDIVLPCAFAK
jgi:hypothetical protein